MTVLCDEDRLLCLDHDDAVRLLPNPRRGSSVSEDESALERRTGELTLFLPYTLLSSALMQRNFCPAALTPWACTSLESLCTLVSAVCSSGESEYPALEAQTPPCWPRMAARVILPVPIRFVST